MAASRRKRVRFTLDMNFESDVSKEAFSDKLAAVRNLLTPRGAPRLDNRELLNILFDRALNTARCEGRSDGVDDAVSTSAPSTGSFLRNSGVLTDRAEGQMLFIAEQQAFSDLCHALIDSCTDGGRWKLSSTYQKGHVLRAEFCCTANRTHRRTWYSSRIFGGRFLVHQKFIHAFTSAGILPSQSIHFSQFASIGVVGKWYIQQVYKSGQYIKCVEECAQTSMCDAVEKVKALGPSLHRDNTQVFTHM